ncbi:UbiA prenyltransferase family, partial [Mycena capillaripes]
MEYTLSFIELARVNKPAGALLILWPFIWGLIMAARTTRTPLLILLQHLCLGCVWFFVLRGAGCIWNDIVDRDIDKQVERTKNRPIANGTISVPEALCFLSVHLIFLSFSIVLWGNKQLSVLGFATIFPLAGGYPFMKRLSRWPQAWLGVAFNTGATMSWSWTTGHIPPSSLALALAGWFWTMWYDTIYGSQDKKDDIKIGLGSTALLFKSSQITKLFLIFHGSMFVMWLTISGILNG